MEVKFEIKNIPKLPGCYIFRNSRDEIIYIGKSKSLRSRVRQYFYESRNRESKDRSHRKYAELVKEIQAVETIVTDTETNALILECQLIKKYKPRYNSQLKKNRIYPFIRIDTKSSYPSLIVTEKRAEDKAAYFGSFYGIDDAISVIELINSIWRTPLCLKERPGRACLNYHLGKCLGPCDKMVEREEYGSKIEEIIKCLKGNFGSTIGGLNREMKEAAKAFEFEKAAKLRDAIDGLYRLKRKQRRIYSDLEGKDVYLFFRAYNEQCFSLFFIKNAFVLNRLDFEGLTEPDVACLEEFVNYNANLSMPQEIESTMTGCILDIGASKYFVPISKKANMVQIVKKLSSAFKEFVIQ